MNTKLLDKSFFGGIDFVFVLLKFTTSFAKFGMLFMALLLKSGFNYTLTDVSFIIVLSSIFFVVGSLVNGYLADKYNQKRLFQLSNLIVVFLFVLLWCVNNRTSVVAIIAVYSFSVACLDPVLNSLASRSVDKAVFVKLFSAMYMAQNLATAIVYFLGGWLVQHIGKLSLLPFAAISLIGAFLSFLLLPKVVLHSKESKKRNCSQDEACSKEKDASISLIIYISIIFLCLATLDAQRAFLLPTWLLSTTKDSFGYLYGIIGVVNGVAVLTLTPFAVRLLKNKSCLFNLGLAGLFYGLGYLILAYSHATWLLVSSTLVWTLGEILAATYYNTFIGTRTPISMRTKLYALPPILLTFGRVISVTSSSYVVLHYGYKGAWVVLVSLGILTFIAVQIPFLFIRKNYETGNYSTSI